MHPPVSIHKSITLQSPIWRVYGQWRRAENFPKFMDTVLEVRQTAKNQLCWHERIDGKEIQTLVEVGDVASNESGFSWKSLSGPKHWGSIRFQAQARGVTLINVEMEYLPEAGSPTAQAFAEKVEGDLGAFKKFVEGQQNREILESTSVHESHASGLAR
jgi:uncharacterized membrane protein